MDKNNTIQEGIQASNNSRIPLLSLKRALLNLCSPRSIDSLDFPLFSTIDNDQIME